MNPEPVNCTASELSIYLRALAAGFLPTFYSDTNPSALSSSMAIASKSWRSGKKTGHFPGFPSLPMSESSTASPGADSLMSSAGDSLARTSPSPEKAQESMASDPVSGVTWRESLARFDPASRMWKTVQHSLLEDSGECSVTWPRSGMTVDGQCYQLPTLGRRTVGSASGLWQTPVADDSVNRAAGKFNSRGEPKLSAQVMLPTPCTVDSGSMFNRSDSPGAALRPTLGAMARFALWPTPMVNGNYNKPGLSAKSGDGLATAVWRTPSASVIDAKSTVVKLTGRKPSDPQVGLAGQVMAAERMATPTARDFKSGKAGAATHAKNSRPLSEQVGGALSPDWVELLMGWPKGWTSSEPLESSEMRGWGEGWEDDTPRVEVGTPNRVQRLKAIGNGQVPQCAAEAWRLLT